LDSLERVYLGIATFLLGATLCGLLLAEAGVFNAYIVGIGSLGALGGFLYVVGKSGVSRMQRPWVVALFLAGLLGYGLLILFPPFNMILGGVDPGLYVNTAANIQASGAILIKDPVVFAAAKVPAISQTFLHWQGQYLPGFYLLNEVIIPQFYHTYPTLMAFAISLVGLKAALYLTPLLALLNAMGLFLVARRWWQGTPTAILAVVLFASNVSFVWFARYADSEMLALQFYLSGLLALHLAEESDTTRASQGWCALSAAFLGAAFLTRLSTIFILPALAVGFLMFTWRDKRRLAATWVLTLGVFVFWTAIHIYFFSFPYFYGVFYENSVLPLLRKHFVLVLLAAPAATALFFVFAWALRSSSPVRDKIAPLMERSGELLLPVTVFVFLGMSFCYYSLHWKILSWMVWYCGVPALALFVVGAILWAKTSGKGSRIPVSLAILVIASLTTFVVLGPDPKVDARQFWASRRLLVFVFPLIALFAARGLSQGARWAGKAGGAALVLITLLPGIHNIRPLLHFEMYRGASQDLHRLAEHIPQKAIVLCGPTGEWKIPTPLRFVYGLNAFGFNQKVLSAEALDALTKTFPGRELDLVTIAPQLPRLTLPYNLEGDPVFSIPLQWVEFNEPKGRLPRAFHTLNGTLELWRIGKRRPGEFFESTAARLEISGVEARGLYGTDPGRTFRWTDGRAELLIPRELVKGSRMLYVEFSDNRPEPAETSIFLNSQEIGTVRVQTHSVTAFSYPLPSGWDSGSQTVRLEFRTPPWVPAQAYGGSDTRNLGVMLLELGFEK
jgi:4-amino-4-deoxy-L-arabinose transferase-like glycosyltransferase